MIHRSSDSRFPGPWLRRARATWAERSPGTTMEILRIGMGAIWSLNLVFIAYPGNEFFETFQSTALSFGSTSVAGPSLADFVSRTPALFAILVAGVTSYLAVAFLLGISTRLACIVGAAFSVALLATQWGSTFVIPGGTDVGPHPLYLLIYGALIMGRAGRSLSLGPRLLESIRARASSPARWPPILRRPSGLSTAPAVAEHP